ncbi:MAG: TetR/AcrR family transcriptional regulator [Chloroflexi bacterium]|nr:TetR/AcrR family transcriptional regulator [Chloroflexota bacterium]
MARTLNPVAHAVRRDAFIDAAQGLIQTRGYERFSLQDVMDATGASKGAFYHYFDSKAALLDAVVNRMADQAIAQVQPLLDDPNLSAPKKLEVVFGGIAQYKAERKDLVLAVMRVWLSDDNAIVREKLKRLASNRQREILEVIVRQGIAEGSFAAGNPDHVALVLVALMQGIGEVALELWVGRQDGTVTFKEVTETFDAYLEAFERIVGVRPGSLQFLDEQALEFWFG